MLLAAASSAAAQDGDWQLGTSPSFSSGRYGTDTRTEIVYTPITARRLFDAGDLTLVVPFLCITGNGGVTVVNGTPIRTDQPVRPGTTGRTRGAAVTPVGAADAAVTTACGLGDLVVRGRYYLLDESGWKPTIALRAHIKAPTASADKSLGTGRPDEGIGIEVSRRVGGGVILMADGGYTLIGKPDRELYRNSWWYDAGIGQDLRGGAINLSLFFEEYSSIVRGLPSARDVLAAVTFTASSGWRAQFGGQFGLSDGAPDHGLIVSASRRF